MSRAKKEPEPEHALLSASGAHIWLECTAMPRACEGIKDEGSVYAQEGTLAHSFCENKVKMAFGLITKRTGQAHLKKLAADPLYTKEMTGYTDGYLDYVKGCSIAEEKAPTVGVEIKVDYSKYAPAGFGTSDCILCSPGKIHVIDFKYGKGQPVYAPNNPQIRLYALGAMEKYKSIYGAFNTVKMTIYQPRLGIISDDEMTGEDLIKWGESIKPKAQAAYYGLGTFHAGEHCHFCNICGNCRARAKTMEKAVDEAVTATGKLPEPPTLSGAELAGFITKMSKLGVETWIKAMTSHAIGELLEGKEIPGYKVVEGRSKRVFKDFAEVEKKLVDSGYDKALLYHMEPETVTGIQNLLGKGPFYNLLSDQIVKSPGRPTLAEESDPRESMHKPTAAEDFAPANVNTETKNED